MTDMIQTRLATLNQTRPTLLLASFFVCWHPSSSMAANPEVQLMLGGFYASGQSDTIASSESEVTGFPIGLNIQKDRWSASVLTSYLNTTQNDATTTSQSASGMGDTFVSIGYDLTQMPWITLSVNHKIPTGSAEKGLSTGESDTGIQLDYFSALSTSSSVFASIGYKSVGKVSSVAMQDPMNASIGLSRFMTESLYIGGSIDYNESIYKELKDTTGVSVFSGLRLNKRHQLLFSTYYDNSDSYQISININIALLD